MLLFTSIIHSQYFIINELDTDTPSTDDKEFIELKTEFPFTSLNGHVLVFFNGTGTNANKSYYTIDLNGLTTDMNGIILIGNTLVSPVPEKIIGLECTIGVENIDDIIEKVKDNEGQILMPKTAIPYVGWIAKFLDTEGNLICAMQYDNTAR